MMVFKVQLVQRGSLEFKGLLDQLVQLVNKVKLDQLVQLVNKVKLVILEPLEFKVTLVYKVLLVWLEARVPLVKMVRVHLQWYQIKDTPHQ